MSYDPLDQRDPEGELDARLELDAIISRLSDDDAHTLRQWLDGHEPDGPYTLRRLVHKVAVAEGAMSRCGACELRLPADRFGWDMYTRQLAKASNGKPSACLACESPFRRYKRTTMERA